MSQTLDIDLERAVFQKKMDTGNQALAETLDITGEGKSTTELLKGGTLVGGLSTMDGKEAVRIRVGDTEVDVVDKTGSGGMLAAAIGAVSAKK